MAHYSLIPDKRIAEFVEDILVIEDFDVKYTFSLPLFANGKPTLLFQTAKGEIQNNSNHLTLFGQTVLPEQITFKEKFTQNELYITERSFQRMFEQKIGISPNQYRRIVQFNAAFQQLNTRKFRHFADIVFNNNYSDQSHFIRVFKEFTNLTPNEYLNLGNND